ncbi:protein SAWADEE HOMEODOMAIN HOMOLOG 1-like isoform X2 [Diospyros lotus]|uniref:protein SAWADEE HOMEODOMAIN HOMOLOG 1-like isoform X2 n=1 Tax=Diospyros lotus TaxID=55363 RepID=UPI0022597B34|nr:protein SAWADEE HOMEODOMAIN HOMOLOG 1-like isoform X2 [Diospyros lotus]
MFLTHKQLYRNDSLCHAQRNLEATQSSRYPNQNPTFWPYKLAPDGLIFSLFQPSKRACSGRETDLGLHGSSSAEAGKGFLLLNCRGFFYYLNLRIEKMEKICEELGEQSIDREFCKKLVKDFNSSKGRVGQPSLKWTEVESWFQDRLVPHPLKNASLPDPPKKLSVVPDAGPLNKAHESPAASKGEKVPDLSELEFEARSSKDGAWYDVDTFLNHRFLSSGEAEVLVRFVGFGSEEDEWLNVKAIRERSVPLEHSECGKVKVGDLVLCFQEKGDQARYYDARVVEIQRRMHDIRGCRCLFLIQYGHDKTEERVRLRRLCCQPTY